MRNIGFPRFRLVALALKLDAFLNLALKEAFSIHIFVTMRVRAGEMDM